MIPDAELITTEYLKAQTGHRVVGETPRNIEDPWVRLTQLDAGNESQSQPDHLIDFLLQLDCYAGVGGGQTEAHLIAGDIRAALHGMPGVRGGATVTCVRFAGMPRIPDTALEPPRQRFILTAHVYMHS